MDQPASLGYAALARRFFTPVPPRSREDHNHKASKPRECEHRKARATDLTKGSLRLDTVEKTRESEKDYIPLRNKRGIFFHKITNRNYEKQTVTEY